MASNDDGDDDGFTVPMHIGGKEGTELTRESSFVMDGDSRQGSGDEYTDDEYSDSGSYVTGETGSDEYTDGSYTEDDYEGSYSGSGSGSEGSFTESEGSYGTGSRGYSAPTSPGGGGDGRANGGRTSGYLPNINSMQKYHTSPDIDVASHRTITVYRNGDSHFAGRAVVIGPQYKSFGYMMDQITIRINSPWGAVRRLYEMDTGHRITSLDEIVDGESYVAAKLERFKKMAYTDIVDWHTKNRHYEAPDLSKLKYKQRKVEGRNMVEHPLTLYVLANRDMDGVVTKVVLRKRDRTSFKHVLDIVTQRLGYRKIQSSAKKMIDLESGDSITKLSQLRHGRFYVAIDRPEQIRMPPFRINSARQLVRKAKKVKRMKNMPIMFDRPIRGKVDVGEKRMERREANGYVSNVGKVKSMIARKPGEHRRPPKELPPIKQPFPRMLTIVQPPETTHYQRVKVQRGDPQDRASWSIVHEYLDEVTTSLVEEVLQEYTKALHTLLNNIVIMRTSPSKRKEVLKMGGSPPPMLMSPEPRGGGDPRTSLASHREEDEDGDSSGSRRPSQNLYDHDQYIDEFLEYINAPDTDIFSTKVTLSPEQKLLKQRFTKAMIAAVDGKLRHWEDEPKTLVMLVILLDQIPRRVYTGTADQYAGDELSRQAINRAIEETDVIQQVEPAHMLYICIALSHQESMREQDLWKRIWKDIERTFPREDVEHVAKQFDRNRSTIEQFGRFPERNEVLRRTNSPEEADWLEAQRAPAAMKSYERMATDISTSESVATERSTKSKSGRRWFGASRTLRRKEGKSLKR